MELSALRAVQPTGGSPLRPGSPIGPRSPGGPGGPGGPCSPSLPSTPGVPIGPCAPRRTGTGVATTWSAARHAPSSSVAAAPPVAHACRTCSARLTERLTAVSRCTVTTSRCPVASSARCRSVEMVASVKTPQVTSVNRAAPRASRSLGHHCRLVWVTGSSSRLVHGEQLDDYPQRMSGSGKRAAAVPDASMAAT